MLFLPAPGLLVRWQLGGGLDFQGPGGGEAEARVGIRGVGVQHGGHGRAIRSSVLGLGVRNVHCKVSALFGRVVKQPASKDIAIYRPILDLACERFGEVRIIFGSDWPVSRTTGDYASVLALTRAYFDAKGPEASGKLFHGNAVRFYAIPKAD